MTAANGRSVAARGDEIARTGADGPVVIADADAATRSLVAHALGRSGLRTVEVADSHGALAAARREHPAVVLLDIGLNDSSSYEVCRVLRHEFDEDLSIVFTSAVRVDPIDRTAGVMLGADDYIVKPFHVEELVARVRRLAARGRDARSARRNGRPLTGREVEILRLLAAGNKPSEIADLLFISRKTVSNHLQRLFTKLDVHSQTQAVAAAFRENLVESGPDRDDRGAHGTAARPT